MENKFASINKYAAMQIVVLFSLQDMASLWKKVIDLTYPVTAMFSGEDSQLDLPLSNQITESSSGFDKTKLWPESLDAQNYAIL